LLLFLDFKPKTHLSLGSERKFIEKNAFNNLSQINFTYFKSSRLLLLFIPTISATFLRQQKSDETTIIMDPSSIKNLFSSRF